LTVSKGVRRIVDSIPGVSDGEERVTIIEEMPSQSGHWLKAPKDRCWLTLLAGPTPGAIYRLEGQTITIGRSPSADVHIAHEALSRLHARLFRVDNAIFLEDLNSANGTYVRERRIAEAVRVFDGDRIELGRSIVFKVAVQDALEEQAALRVYSSSVRDTLTGLFNRHFFQDRFESEFAFAKRHNTLLTVILLDIDWFKSVNDTHGHPAGDAVLRSVGAALSRVTRKEDLTARYGGEEFLLLFRAASLDDARVTAERIRRAIEATETPWQDRSLRVTVSIGVATMHRERTCSTPGELLALADLALYAAKRSGRNRIYVG
jgi:two-component system cell cycle response regulator